MSDMKCVTVQREHIGVPLTAVARRTTTPYNSPELHFDCPSNVSSFEVWKEATPMLGRKGFQATGAGCTATTKYNGASCFGELPNWIHSARIIRSRISCRHSRIF